MVESLKQKENQYFLIQEFKKELKDYGKQINTLNKTQKETLEFSFAK
jgi:hypothetical protein